MGGTGKKVFHKLSPSRGNPKGEVGGQATGGKGTKSKLNRQLMGRRSKAPDTGSPFLNAPFRSERSLDLSQIGLGVGPNTKGNY